jgi:hypothetical protein
MPHAERPGKDGLAVCRGRRGISAYQSSTTFPELPLFIASKPST